MKSELQTVSPDVFESFIPVSDDTEIAGSNGNLK